MNNNWEKTIEEFVEKYNTEEEISQADLEVFFEEGFIPLLDEYYTLLAGAADLVDAQLQAFEEGLNGRSAQLKKTPLTQALTNLLFFLNKEENLQ